MRNFYHKTETILKILFISFLLISLVFFPEVLLAQTCPNGSPTASTGYGVTASGGASGTANATGTILSSGSTLNGSNSAVSSTSSALVIDLQKWVAQGSTLTIAWSRSSGTPSGTVSVSNDNVFYASLGNLSGSASTSSIYSNFTVPSGGLRYVRILGTAGVFFVDGVRYTHTCYYPAQSAKDNRVVLSPGTAKGDVSTNDLNYDNDAKTFSLLNNVSNGNLVFNSNGTYSYTPSIGFEGVDVFSYVMSDAGPDGNIATTGDNALDTANVVFRTLFNCDSMTFFLPVPENEAMDFLKDISPTSGNNSDPTVVYIGISVATDAIVIYDHWEDGFETDIKAPTQSTTQIWGDMDLSNGVAPGFPDDVLDAGQAIILSNSLSSGHSGSTSYNPNAVGSDATLQATVDYDGKDKVFIGGIGAMTKLAWGSLGTPSVCGAAVPPTKKWGTSYVLPVGINTSNSGTGFQISSLSILASENGTTVNIDRDANGSVDITVSLAQGETYYLDSRVSGSAVTVNQGATISANKPIMVTMMTGQYNASPYQSRTFNLIPNSQLSSCYYMPGVPQETMRVFLYNPNGSSITVTRTTASGATTNITVAANSGNYNDVNSSGLGYRYCSSSNFAILSAVDYNSGTSDWGFLPVPSANLTSKVLVGYGDGVDPLSGSLGTLNYEQAMITVDCNTYLYVDINGDLVPDKVSFNNDVDATDASVSIGGINYNETTSNNGIYLQAYQTLTVGSTSGSLNGAVFWTKTAANNTGNDGCNLALVWGQNGGPSTSPNIDAGYMVPNINPEINNQVNKSSDSVIVGLSADSIRLTYANAGAVAPYRVFWFNESTNNYSVFNTSSDSFTIYDVEPGYYLVKLKDANCRNFTQRILINEIPSARVNGRIYHDANGQTNSTIDGVGIGSIEGNQLYVYIVKSNGIILDSARVDNTGSFSLIGRQNWNYTIRVSTIGAGFGSTVPAVNLPANWVNVAEQFGSGNNAGSGIESGSANGILNTGIGSTAISSLNFSIEKTMISHDKTYSISPDSVLRNASGNGTFPHLINLYHSSGTADTSVVSLLSSVMPGKLSGIDYEDGRFGGNSGSFGNLVLTQLPDTSNDGVLVYNGIILYPNPAVASPSYVYWNSADSRYEIPNFNPSLLQMFVRVAYQMSSEFEYAFLDEAEVLGTAATYRINYLSPLPLKIDFYGTKLGSRAVLNWTCHNTEGIAYYEIERQFEGDLVPVTIARIDESGSFEYRVFDDMSLLNKGIYDYMLYAIDLEGNRTYHGVASLYNGESAKAELKAFPNPGSGDINIGLSGFDSRSLKKIEVYSTDGKLVYTTEFVGDFIIVGTDDLAEGLYHFKVMDAKAESSQSVLIRR